MTRTWFEHVLVASAGDRNIDSDKEGNGNILDQNGLPNDIAGDMEINGENVEDNEERSEQFSILWRQ